MRGLADVFIFPHAARSPLGLSSKCSSLGHYVSRKDFAFSSVTWCRISSVFRHQGSNKSLSSSVQCVCGWAHCFSFISVMFHNLKFASLCCRSTIKRLLPQLSEQQNTELRVMVVIWVKVAEDLQSLENPLWCTEFSRLHGLHNSGNTGVVISFIFGEKSNVQISYPFHSKEAPQRPNGSSSAWTVLRSVWTAERSLSVTVELKPALRCMARPHQLLVLKDCHILDKPKVVSSSCFQEPIDKEELFGFLMLTQLGLCTDLHFHWIQ